MDSFVYEETTFLNVDLDLESRSDLQPFVNALAPGAFPLHVGRDRRTYKAYLELSRQPKNPDTAIRSFAALIHKVPAAERKLWHSARVRDFNVGIQAAEKPRAYVISLSPETIELVSTLKARVVFTIYSPETSQNLFERDSKTSIGKKRV